VKSKYQLEYGGRPVPAWLRIDLTTSVVSKTGKTTSIPVQQISRDGTVIAEYESVNAAAHAIGLSDITIRGVLKGRHKTAGGYIWKRK